VSGRTARHVNGRVILYADQVTGSMKRMIAVTDERRRRQTEYNRLHNITPRSVVKEIREGLVTDYGANEVERRVLRESGEDYDVHEAMQEIEREMLEAAAALEFERAAILRDELSELKRQTGDGAPAVRGAGEKPFISRKQRGKAGTRLWDRGQYPAAGRKGAKPEARGHGPGPER